MKKRVSEITIMNELRSQFVKNLSYQLRTSLTFMLNPLETMLSDKKFIKYRHEVKTINHHARELLTVLDDIFDIEKLESSGTELHYAQVNLAAIYGQVVVLAEPLAHERHINFDVEIPQELIAEVDPNKFVRIMTTLLSATVKFTHENGSVYSALVCVDRYAKIIIMDSGPGLSSIENASGDSLALGLAIIKNLLELHEGKITLEKSSNGGTITTLLLPLKAKAGVPVQLDYQFNYLPEAMTFTSVKRKRQEHNKDLPIILVVEDNIEMNNHICEILSVSYRSEAAYDGLDALQKIINLKPDLIITEILLPKLDGIQLLTEIRKQPALDNMQVIILTFKEDDQLCAELFAKGAQDYIPKPFSQAELLARVKNLISLKTAKTKLAEKNVALAAANQELDAFTHSVSHDLRNPLNIITGLTSILLNFSKVTEQDKQHLNRILINAKRMEDIITGLFTLSHASRNEIQYQNVDLGALAMNIFLDLKEQNPSRNVKLVLGNNIHAQGDSHLLELLLENLIRNAWKFTANNHQPCIRIGMMKINHQHIYFVRDNGVGFPQENAKKLFKVFSRLHSSSEFPGSGIGLTIVQRVVERHGGTITVRSKVGKGTTFYFTLSGENPAMLQAIAGLSKDTVS